jgi:hypothetical protein
MNEHFETVRQRLGSAGRRVARGFYATFGPTGCSVMSADWDNLLILDGCRFDLFEQVNTVDGELHSRISSGSATPEFLDENFAGDDYHDTVYVTANPMYRLQDLEGTFHAVVDVWEDHWDDELKTVLPDPMTAATREAHETYPNKRILSHFMQPHYPFVGRLGQSLGEQSGWEFTYRRVTDGDGDGTSDAPNVWQLLEDGVVSTEDVWAAYRENLEIVLSYVEELVDDLEGRTVVTSDHGNMLGEFALPFPKRVYGHPRGIHTKELVKVPWLVIDGTTRKTVTAERPVSGRRGETSAAVSERLSDLGYTDP